jgi:hypothetical protein
MNELIICYQNQSLPNPESARARFCHNKSLQNPESAKPRVCQSQSAKDCLPNTVSQSQSAKASQPKPVCQSQSAKASLPKPICQSQSAKANLPKPVCQSQSAKARVCLHQSLPVALLDVNNWSTMCFTSHLKRIKRNWQLGSYTLHFIFSSLIYEPYKLRFCPWQKFPALSHATLYLIWSIQKIQRKWIVLNTDPGDAFTTLHFLHIWQVGSISSMFVISNFF